jgi:hypothetical protein
MIFSQELVVVKEGGQYSAASNSEEDAEVE